MGHFLDARQTRRADLLSTCHPHTMIGEVMRSFYDLKGAEHA
jgi:hypothetical protein